MTYHKPSVKPLDLGVAAASCCQLVPFQPGSCALPRAPPVVVPEPGDILVIPDPLTMGSPSESLCYYWGSC